MVPVKPGLHELLDFLRARKIKIAVATSSNRDTTLHLLTSAKVKDYFDAILCGDEIVKSKPDPEIFLKAAEKLQCLPSHCIVLEDSSNGVLAAHHAGMKVIMIPDLVEPTPETLCYVFKQMYTLSEVKNYLEAF